ncbi:MAG: hypothetical protein COA32_08370 [Fluviicola sp.]|nr:MAG: hypothetical protein COA32_08370 [Fluviicola sp.]
MKLILITSFLVLSTFIFAQDKVEIVVLDKQTKEPVSFVKIGNKAIEPILTDIDGKATLEVDETLQYHFSFYDYKDTSILGSVLLNEKVVLLTPDSQILDEVVITPGENPAHRIVQNAMDRRKDNDPLRNNSFKYKSFSKFYLTGEVKEGVVRDTISDTSELKMFELLDEQYLFLTETASKRTFSPPSYDKEEVTSYKVSGLNNPMLATLASQLQSFSFYDNIFTIGGSDYVNPIAPGGIRRYLFVLEDTLFHDQDTTYTISFRPRKGKNFDGLSGYLFIHTNGWALERVIASPYGDNSLGDLKIIQEYKFTNDKKWFPYELSTEIVFEGLQLGNYSNAIGRSSLYINDVEFDVPVKKGFNPVQLEVSVDAANDTVGLEEARGNKSTDKELQTYKVIDSLGEEANFERMAELLSILATGKIPIGKISIPLRRITDFNQQEGFRLGLGLETNQRFSRVFGIGGYFAYGFRDKSWKWGGDLNVTFHQKRQINLELRYRDDLFERGGVDFQKDNFDLTGQSLYRNFFINRLDRERFAGVTFSGLVTPNFKVQLVGNYRRIRFTDDYAYAPLFEDINPAVDQFDVAETGLIVTWNIREKIMMLGDRRVSMGTKFPRLTFKAMKGWDEIFEGEYEYYRLNFNIDQTFTIRGLGRINLQSTNGMTIGNVPLALQQIQYGTGKNWNLVVPNTFETMQPAEFFSDAQSNLFFRLRFLPLKNKTDWTEPQFVLHSAAGFGTMYNRTDHLNYAFKVPEKGYYESGLIIENLLKSGLTGLGIGVFHRYGPYANPALKDNFVYKLSLTYNL